MARRDSACPGPTTAGPPALTRASFQADDLPGGGVDINALGGGMAGQAGHGGQVPADRVDIAGPRGQAHLAHWQPPTGGHSLQTCLGR